MVVTTLLTNTLKRSSYRREKENISQLTVVVSGPKLTWIFFVQCGRDRSWQHHLLCVDISIHSRDIRAQSMDARTNTPKT